MPHKQPPGPCLFLLSGLALWWPSRLCGGAGVRLWDGGVA